MISQEIQGNFQCIFSVCEIVSRDNEHGTSVMCGFGTCLLPDMVVSCLASVLRILLSRGVCLF